MAVSHVFNDTMKYLRLITALTVPALSAGSLIAVGYASWVFLDVQTATASGEVVVASESVLNGALTLSRDQYYSEFRIVFSQGGAEHRYEANYGIDFVPEIDFTFTFTTSTLNTAEFDGTKFYIDCSFTTESTVFNNYAYLVTSDSKVELFGISDVTATSTNPTIVEETDGITYTYTGFYTPAFAYVSENKPTTESAYNTMINELNNDDVAKTITLTVALEKETTTS